MAWSSHCQFTLGIFWFLSEEIQFCDISELGPQASKEIKMESFETCNDILGRPMNVIWSLHNAFDRLKKQYGLDCGFINPFLVNNISEQQSKFYSPAFFELCNQNTNSLSRNEDWILSRLPWPNQLLCQVKKKKKGKKVISSISTTQLQCLGNHRGFRTKANMLYTHSSNLKIVFPSFRCLKKKNQ